MWNLKNCSLFFISFLIVAFGQPVWSSLLAITSACCGFALFWLSIINLDSAKQRFLLATFWYTGVQCLQLNWMISHPFWYIYLVWLLFSFFIGLQFGLMARWITPNHLKASSILSLSCFWTLMEWLRLFFLSGYTWNPIGLALTGSLYSLQVVSVGGVYLLSFWVVLTNLILLKFWTEGFPKRVLMVWMVAMATPFLFGAGHYHWHNQKLQQSELANVLLVQPGFHIETEMPFSTAYEARLSVIDKWGRILDVLKKYRGRPIDLIALPEYVVPYGTYYAVFPENQVLTQFTQVFGKAVLSDLPPLKEPYALNLAGVPYYFVNNAYFAQAISNLFQSHVLIGLEDTEEIEPGKIEAYSAGFWFSPDAKIPERYEKRVLVPLGEYIPFNFLNDLAASYGIKGSFTCGKGAKVFTGNLPMGLSICYEETHGHLMRESRLQGAEILVNLTNDGWFPHSILPKVHFDHARLRSVENGIPLVRACNTGVTGAFDSLGQIIGVLGDFSYDSQRVCDALWVEVPTYHYATLYTIWGDNLIVSICLMGLMGSGLIDVFKRLRMKK